MTAMEMSKARIEAGGGDASDHALLAAEAKASNKGRVLDRMQLVEELVAEAVERERAREADEPLGPEVANVSPELHRAIGEALPVGVTTFDGGPGSGKTALGTQIAMTCRVPAIIVECEVRPVRMLERMTAFQTKTYLGKLKDGTLSPEQIGAFAKRTLDEVPLLEIIDATHTRVSLDEIADEAKRLRERHNAKHCLVLLDSLHAWSAAAMSDDFPKEYDRLTQAILDLDAASKRAGISVLAILERSLASMNNPSASSGKGTGALGYKGEISINLDATGKLDRLTGERPVRMTISKNRHGEQGFAIPMIFEGRVQTFREMPQGDALAQAIAATGGDLEDDSEATTPVAGFFQGGAHRGE